MITRYQPIAAALSLFLAVPAFAADDAATASTVTVHEQMMNQIRDLQDRSQASQSIDHWMLIAAKMAVRIRESADTRLHAIVAGYDRAGLDRGVWRNAVQHAEHHAAPDPLLNTAVGSGVTTHGADGVPRPPLVATR